MFKDFGDAAKEATATQVRLESKTGIEAYLSLLVTSIDELENRAINLMNQVYFPERPSSWNSGHVKRTRDFSPDNIDETISAMQQRYLGGKPVPITTDMLLEKVKEILQKDSIFVDEDQEELLREKVDAFLNSESQANDLEGALGL